MPSPLPFRPLPVLATAALLLAACGEAPDSDANSADAFAARIGSNGAAPAPATATAPANAVPPTVAQPLPGAAPGAFARGTATDPASSTCGANLMGPYIGKPADDGTRAAVVKTLGRSDRLRFVEYGSTEFINPDPTNPRLSLMLDEVGIIRDARCG